METVIILIFHLAVFFTAGLVAIATAELKLAEKVKKAIVNNNGEVSLDPYESGIGKSFYLMPKGRDYFTFISFSIKQLFSIMFVCGLALCLYLISFILTVKYPDAIRQDDIAYNAMVIFSAAVLFTISFIIFYKQINKIVKEIFEKNYVFLCSDNRDLSIWVLDERGYVYRAMIEFRKGHLETHTFTYPEMSVSDIDVPSIKYCKINNWNIYSDGKPFIDMEHHNLAEAILIADSKNKTIKVPAI